MTAWYALSRFAAVSIVTGNVVTMVKIVVICIATHMYEITYDSVRLEDKTLVSGSGGKFPRG